MRGGVRSPYSLSGIYRRPLGPHSKLSVALRLKYDLILLLKASINSVKQGLVDQPVFQSIPVLLHIIQDTVSILVVHHTFLRPKDFATLIG